MLVASLLACGCGSAASCPSLPPAMNGLAAHAASLDVLVYGDGASCAGDDVAPGAPVPLEERRFGAGGDATFQLPAGRYLIVVRAYDAAGALIGSGCAVEQLRPGQRACLELALGAPAARDAGMSSGADAAPPPSFTAQPSSTASSLFQVWYAGGDELFAVGAKGTILHTANGGASWQAQASNTTQDLESVWGSAPGDVYAVGLAATVLHSANGGASWQRLTVPVFAGNSLWDVWGSGPGDVYIVGDRGTVLHGSGASFSAVNIGLVTGAVTEVWGSGGGDVYLFGGSGLVMHGSAAVGFLRQNAGSSSDNLMYGWGSADGSDVWVISQNGAGTVYNILHTGDRGATWTTQLSSADRIAAMWSTAAGHGYAVGAQILESGDHGAHWTAVMPAPAPLYGIGGDPSGARGVWTVGANGTILHRP